MPKFEKGVSGNPHGRPKGTSMGDTLRAMLHIKCKESPWRKYTNKEALAVVLYKAAIVHGDVGAAKLIISYTDGAPTQTIEGTLETTDPQTEKLKNNVADLNRAIAGEMAEIEKLQKAVKRESRKS